MKDYKDKAENNNKKQHKNNRLHVVGIVALACISLFFIGYTFAKYVFKQDTQNHGVKATDFIFSSNLLDNDETERTFDLYGAQAQSVKFTIDNFTDELNINESDITYTISATATNAYIPVLDTQVAMQGSGYVLTGNTQSSHEFELDMPQGYLNGTVVTVTATSLSPYEKTITLEFCLHIDSLVNQYRIEDRVNSYAMNLIVMVKDEMPVTISWDPTEFSIDCTNVLVMNNGVVPNSVETGTLTLLRNLLAGESVTIVFFKTNITHNHSTNGNVPFGTTGNAISVT